MGISSGRMEAAVVNRRLRKYAEDRPESDVEGVGSTLDFARKNAIPVAPSAIAAVGSNLRRLMTKNVSPDVISLAHRVAESAASLQSSLLMQPGSSSLRHVSKLPPTPYLIGAISTNLVSN